jgi:hypothetical protein
MGRIGEKSQAAWHQGAIENLNAGAGAWFKAFV